MITAVGVFKDVEAARAAHDQLVRAGIPEDRQILLLPGASQEALAHVPVIEGEQPGMGKVVGGLLGTAMGLGAAMSVVAIPGVGPVTVIGMLGLALFTAGGMAAGIKVGDMLDDRMDEGLPVDELYVYEDALRQGRSVVLALATDDEQGEEARAIMDRAGAESIDAARDQWWIGLRSAERAAYPAADWEREEAPYRAGFEAALLGVTRGRSFDEMRDFLARQQPELYARESFRRGYHRGQDYERARSKRG